jgi:hypothetical protein
MSDEPAECRAAGIRQGKYTYQQPIPLNATTADTCKPWRGPAWLVVQEEGSDEEESDPGGDDGTVLGFMGRLEQKSLLAPTCDFEQESMCGANDVMLVQWATGVAAQKHNPRLNPA